MRVASAPHFPAEPRALVGCDVLEVLGSTNGTDDSSSAAVVRRLFSNTDASRFSNTVEISPDLLLLEPQLNAVLENLEAKL